MNSESTTIIGWVIILLVNIIGWWISFNQNNKSKAEAARIAKEAAAMEANAIRTIVDALPCVKNSSYQLQFGELLEKVRNIKEQLDRIIANGRT